MQAGIVAELLRRLPEAIAVLKQALELCISRLRDSGAPMTSRSQTKSPAAFFPSSRSGKSKDSGGSGLG